MRSGARVIATIAAVLTGFAGPALAAGGDIAVENGDDTVGAVVTREGSGRGGPRCSWQSVDGDGETGSGRSDAALTSVDGDVVRFLYKRTCPDGSVTFVWVAQRTAASLIPALRDEVSRRLHYPEPVILPFNDERGWTYVQTPIDVRTAPGSWEPIVATASIDGPPGFNPWVTITAEPVELRFASGDPADPVLVGCAGTAAIAPYDPAVPGACSFTYHNASSTVAGDAFNAELAIVWRVTYESSDGSGSLDLDPTVTRFPIRVAEIQALVTCTGPNPSRGDC